MARLLKSLFGGIIYYVMEFPKIRYRKFCDFVFGKTDKQITNKEYAITQICTEHTADSWWVYGGS